jgi:hypothetical protein
MRTVVPSAEIKQNALAVQPGAEGGLGKYQENRAAAIGIGASHNSAVVMLNAVVVTVKPAALLHQLSGSPTRDQGARVEAAVMCLSVVTLKRSGWHRDGRSRW